MRSMTLLIAGKTEIGPLVTCKTSSATFIKCCYSSYFPFFRKRPYSNNLIKNICCELEIASDAILRILLKILSIPVVLKLDTPRKRWQTLLTVIATNAKNLDLAVLMYSWKLQSDVPILFLKSGPIFEKKTWKPSAMSLGLVRLIPFTYSSFNILVFFPYPANNLLFSKLPFDWIFDQQNPSE